jgi:hypothetical protein
MLDKLGILNSIYSINGERDFDRIILEWGLKWRIYYIDERGGENEIAKFETEEDACEYFFNMMKKNKEIEEKMRNFKPNKKDEEKKRIFIVSNTGDTNIQKDD